MFFLNWRRYLVWRLVERSTLDDRSASCGWTFACLLLLLLLLFGPYHTNLPPCMLMGWLCGDSLHACRGPQHINPEGTSSPRAWCDSSEIKKTLKNRVKNTFGVCLFYLIKPKTDATFEKHISVGKYSIFIHDQFYARNYKCCVCPIIFYFETTLSPSLDTLTGQGNQE